LSLSNSCVTSKLTDGSMRRRWPLAVAAGANALNR
jgi:hypothetical protein